MFIIGNAREILCIYCILTIILPLVLVMYTIVWEAGAKVCGKTVKFNFPKYVWRWSAILLAISLPLFFFLTHIADIERDSEKAYATPTKMKTNKELVSTLITYDGRGRAEKAAAPIQILNFVEGGQNEKEIREELERIKNETR